MKKLLVVDDELGTLRAMYRVLKIQGYEVSAANSVMEGLETIEMLKNTSEELELVVADIQMPDQNGMDLLLKVKELYPNLPVIIITAYGTEEVEKTFREAGCNDFIHKPFSIEALIGSIKKLESNN